ncbi:MAG: hypothetical protein ABII27_08805 [bacterium]
MTHAITKPMGYPGDYKMLEIVYNRKTITTGIGKYFDHYCLNTPYAIAVRNRKDLTREILKKCIGKVKKGEVLKILNLACGSCRELREIFDAKTPCLGKVIFTCVDHDTEALGYSKAKIDKIKPSWAKINYVNENVLKYKLNNRESIKKLGTQDIVYSIGLSDYLPDRILTNIIKFSMHLTSIGGKFIVACKDRDKYKPVSPDWYTDWHFVPRNEEVFLSLVKNACGQNCKFKTMWEKTGNIIITIINKYGDL